MKHIWLVKEDFDYEESIIVGAYSTEAKARAELNRRSDYGADIEKVAVDPPTGVEPLMWAVRFLNSEPDVVCGCALDDGAKLGAMESTGNSYCTVYVSAVTCPEAKKVAAELLHNAITNMILPEVRPTASQLNYPKGEGSRRTVGDFEFWIPKEEWLPCIEYGEGGLLSWRTHEEAEKRTKILALQHARDQVAKLEAELG